MSDTARQDRRSKRQEVAARIREQQDRIEATRARIRSNGQEFRDRHLERRRELLGRLEETASRLELNARRLESGEPEQTSLMHAGPMQLEIRDPERSSFRNGLAVGLGVVALVGLAGVVFYLVSRKKDGTTQIVTIPASQAPNQLAGHIIEAAPSQVIQVAPAAQSRFGSVIMKSFNLPSINDKQRPAVRVANATHVPYEVTLRTVGPAGEYAYFSSNASELNNFRGGTPIGETLILPAGEKQTIPLKPHEALYAKGSLGNTVISVTMNELMG